MKPPIVTDETSPRAHKTNKIIAIVPSTFELLFRTACQVDVFRVLRKPGLQSVRWRTQGESTVSVPALACRSDYNQ
jgi:hypothetical protein